MEYRYDAIILRKRETGETDRLYTLYTREQGKVRALAKGVRKPEAKLAAQLETLAHSQITVIRGRGTGKIAGAYAEQGFPAVHADFEALRTVLGAAASFERLVDLEEPDTELFALLLEYLSLAEAIVSGKAKGELRLLTQGFLLQLLGHLGYRLDTSACAVSGTRLRAGERYFFSPAAGGVIMGDVSGNRDAFPISENAIKLIRLLISNRLASLGVIQADEKTLRETGHVASRFLRWIAQ